MAEIQLPEGQINGATLPVTSTENVGTKRQRRPSVRLGDIGDQPYDSHSNRRTKQWKLPMKDPSKSSKTRPSTLTGGDYNETLDEQDKEPNSNLVDTVAIGSWKVRDPKSRRGSKNVRSSWVSMVDEDGFRDFDREASEDSPIQPHHDTDTDGTRNWNNLERDGVRVWLNELGLGRYAPLFEIHEVDDEVLPMLTLEDLKDMGINAVGSRRKMYSSIQKLGKGFS